MTAPLKPIIMPYRGTWPKIDDSAFVAPGAAIAGDLILGPEASIWFNCTVRADVNLIRIGARSNIQDGTTIHCTYEGHGTFIGADVTVGHNAILHACTLEDGAFVGMQACVLDGCVVESGAMIAAGALMTPGKRAKKGEMWAGNPARPLRPVKDSEKAMFREIVERYVGLGREFKAACQDESKA